MYIGRNAQNKLGNTMFAAAEPFQAVAYLSRDP